MKTKVNIKSLTDFAVGEAVGEYLRMRAYVGSPKGFATDEACQEASVRGAIQYLKNTGRASSVSKTELKAIEDAVWASVINEAVKADYFETSVYNVCNR